LSGHADLKYYKMTSIVWSFKPQVLQKHVIHMQTDQRSSLFLLLVPMAELEGEPVTLLRVDMAGLALVGDSFFNGHLLLVWLLTCAILSHVLLTRSRRICYSQLIWTCCRPSNKGNISKPSSPEVVKRPFKKICLPHRGVTRFSSWSTFLFVCTSWWGWFFLPFLG
jgi:hypothetical protein